MKNQISAYLNQGIYLILVAILALTPLIFSPLTTEFFETPKLIFLVSVVLILLVLWSLSWLIKRRVSLVRTPLDIPLILLLLIILLSTFFSDIRYISALGNFPRVHGSAVSWICYILLYFIATSTIRTESQVKTALYALLSSSLVVLIITLLSYFKLFLPFTFAQVANFTPTGSSSATAALLILLLPLTLISIFKPTKFIPRIAGIILSSLFILTIALVGNPAIYLATAVVIILTLFIQRRSFDHDLTKNLVPKAIFEGQSLAAYLPWLGVIFPIITLLIIIFSFVSVTQNNLLYQARKNFPQEIQLPLGYSWKVAVSSFRDNPFLGTGPSTYLFNFTQYKPTEINLTQMWNVKFDQGFNEYFQILSTLGGLGILAFLFLIVVILNFALKTFHSFKDNPLTLSLGISSIAVVVLLAVHASNVVSIVSSMAILALLMVSSKESTTKIEELTDSSEVLPIILFIPILILAIYAFANGQNIVLADYHHRLALNATNSQSSAVYNNLVLAERFNPRVDLYRTDLAQTNFVLANSLATDKGPSEASPSGSLTAEDKKNIQLLLSQAIAEGKAATELSPNNSTNWEILGSIYRQISGVAENALQFSLDSYGRAIQKDPFNPLLRLNVGGIYYSIKNYDLALRFFSDAINLKPDYANAYYNLAVVLKDKGDLKSAQNAAEKVVSLVDPKSQDYQFASKFLADLKAEVATSSAALENPKASNLQQEQLPKVLNLPKPSSIATPEAVKKP